MKNSIMAGWLALSTLLGSAVGLHAADVAPLLAQEPATADVRLVGPAGVASVFVDAAEPAVGRHAADQFAADIERVTGRKPTLSNDTTSLKGVAVLIGTVGSSKVIDRLIADGKLDAKSLNGQWESFVIQSVEAPLPGVDRALVIAGSDRRGTAYGVFEVSEQIGVSPWYWWADVTPTHRDTLTIKAGTYKSASPTVKYRGIFINDEDWGLQPWAAKTFDPEFKNIGPKTYEKVFELLLRLKGNLLWPAMHHCSTEFGSVDRNVTLADEWGIVMGSAHSEPMNRNNVWWSKDGKGDWRYDTNRENVLEYWRTWAKKRGPYEAVWTVGMRGIHDSGMNGPKDLPSQVRLLEKVIADQRGLLKEYVSPQVDDVPQVFTPYKEALEQYQHGLKLPDDVTILWCEDNYGYVRQLSSPAEQKRSGGSGVYYHISYLGWPRPYLWVNTTPPALIWEEMNKALAYGADRAWVLNVGDIKPGEIGIDFWMKLGWNAKRYGPDAQQVFLREWAAREFGEDVADEVASIMNELYQLGLQRKPELMEEEIFSVVQNEESQRRQAAYLSLDTRATKLNDRLPQAKRDAFYELVQYPVRVAATVNDGFTNGDLSRLYALQGRAVANQYADAAAKTAPTIEQETARYNNQIAGGKWRGIMTAKGIGGDWNVKWPAGARVTPTSAPGMGVVVEGQGVPLVAAVAKPSTYIDLAASEGKLSGVFQRKSDGNVKYVVAPNGVGDVLEAGKGATATYRFDVPRDGRFNLFMSINCPNDKDDSLFIKIDNGEWANWNGLGTRSAWDWRLQAAYDLKAGAHTLTIAQREDGAMFSRIRLTDADSPERLDEKFANGKPNELPTFDPVLASQHFIDVFDTSDEGFDFTATPSAPWIRVSESTGTVKRQQRLWVTIDWASVPAAKASGSVTVRGGGSEQTIAVTVDNRAVVNASFGEVDGYVSMEAEHFTRSRTAKDEAKWNVIKGLGRTGDAMTVLPANTPSRADVAAVTTNSPALEYDIETTSAGTGMLSVYCLPTHRIHEGRGVRYAVSIDDAPPTIVDFEESGGGSGEQSAGWRNNVSRNVSISTSKHAIAKPGLHTVKLWMVDPGVVVDKLVLDLGGLKPSELGPPETRLATPSVGAQ